MIDSHAQGPASNGYGAVPVMRGVRTQFGVSPAGRRTLLKTNGATAAAPLIVELLTLQKTAFNGTSPEVAITSEKSSDGSDDTTHRAIANIGTPTYILVTEDRTFYVDYTLATGSPTAGDVTSFARVSGIGQLPAVI